MSRDTTYIFTAEREPNGLNESVDRKFKILAVNPYNGKVYDDHHAVLFLAKDKAFLETLPTYIENCKKLGASEEQIKSASLLLDRVRQYQIINSDLIKVPDLNLEEQIHVGRPNRS